MILAEISELPVVLIPEEALKLDVRKDLIASLEQQLCGPEDEEDTQDKRPLKKFKNSSSNIDDNMASKTSQVLWMLENRVATSRVGATASSAALLLAGMSSSSASTLDQLEELQSKHTLRRHLLLLDAAVDRCTAEDRWTLKKEGRFAGVALATDESPPSQPRFRGLRFQITLMY